MVSGVCPLDALFATPTLPSTPTIQTLDVSIIVIGSQLEQEYEESCTDLLLRLQYLADFSMDSSPDRDNTLKTEQNTEDREVGILDGV